MKRVILSLIAILLVVPLIPYGEEVLTGYIARSLFAEHGKKITADKDVYVLPPNQKTLHLTLTAKDNYVWKAGWYCKQPCYKSNDWVTFDFEGSVLTSAEELRWMEGKAGVSSVLNIPRQHLKSGKNYFAAYTCEGVNKCNDNKWLLLPVEVLLVSDASDLSVSSVYVDMPERNTGSFFIVVKNGGNIPSPSGVLSYRVTDIDTGNIMVESRLVMPSILAGKTGVTSRVAFPLGKTIKTMISILLDPDDKIIEIDEKNNGYYVTKEFNPRYPSPPP